MFSAKFRAGRAEVWGSAQMGLGAGCEVCEGFLSSPHSCPRHYGTCAIQPTPCGLGFDCSLCTGRGARRSCQSPTVMGCSGAYCRLQLHEATSAPSLCQMSLMLGLRRCSASVCASAPHAQGPISRKGARVEKLPIASLPLTGAPKRMVNTK